MAHARQVVTPFRIEVALLKDLEAIIYNEYSKGYQMLHSHTVYFCECAEPSS